MNKDELLNKINILLISDNEKDYQELVDYGFKNIVRFKSIINADKYFASHPDDFNKFHFTIKSRQKVQRVCFHGDTELDSNIYNLPHEVANLYIWDYTDNNNYRFYLDGNRLEASDMKTILDYYMNKLLKDVLLQKNIKKATPIVIEEPKMPIKEYPKSKKDLKILVLLSGIVFTTDDDAIRKYTGTNAEIIEDNNSSLGKYVIRNMADYDIIIASKVYSGSLIEMNQEYTEQAKLTGRRLGLVAIYDHESIYNVTSDGDFLFDYIGTELIVKTAMGGLDAQNPEINKTSYKVKADNRVISSSSIIEKAIINYHEELKKINGVGLENVEPNKFSRYEEDYEKANKKYEEDKKAYISQVTVYDNVLASAQKYLSNKKKGLIKKSLEELKITESDNGITIESYLGSRKICTIVMSQNPDNKNRVFYIQTLKENGTPTGLCEVAIYPIEKRFNLTRPNDKQLSAIFNIWKKMENNLIPINESVTQQVKLSKKNKNRRKNRQNKQVKY